MPADNYCATKLRNTAMKIALAVATIALLAASSAPGTTEPLLLVGATTFTAEVMVPHQAEIEAISGQKMILLPNRSSLGVYGLFEGHHIAMISTSLPSLINDLRKERPDLAYDKLRVFNIATTRAVFSIHPSNPIRFADFQHNTSHLDRGSDKLEPTWLARSPDKACSRTNGRWCSSLHRSGTWHQDISQRSDPSADQFPGQQDRGTRAGGVGLGTD